MRQGIRSLGWAVIVLQVLLFFFLVTSIYSMLDTLMMRQAIRVGEMKLGNIDGGFMLSMPLTVNNTGYFDFSDFKFAVALKDQKGVSIADNEVLFKRISSGSSESKTLNLSLNIFDLIRRNSTYLLFNDTEIIIDNNIELRYAGLFGFKISVPNATIAWRAPFRNIQLGSPSEPQPTPGNPDVVVTKLPFSFDNNSPISIYGIVFIKMYNKDGVLLASGNKTLTVEPGMPYSGEVELEIDVRDLQKFTSEGYLEVNLVTPEFTLNFPGVEFGGR